MTTTEQDHHNAVHGGGDAHPQQPPTAPNHDDNDDNDSNDGDDDNNNEDDDAAHTFRKRRLSLPNLRQLMQRQQQQQQQIDSEREEEEEAAKTATQEEQEEQEMLGYELDAEEDEPQPQEQQESRMMNRDNLSGDHNHHQVSEQDQDDEKAHTFRKRRLSLTSSSSNHSHDHYRDATAAAAAAAVAADSPISAADSAANKRQRRRSSADSSLASTTGSCTHNIQQQAAAAVFRSRTVHAGELLGGGGPPPSPALHAGNVLYQQSPLPPPSLMLESPQPHDGDDATSNDAPNKNGNAASTTSLQQQHDVRHQHHLQPKWKRRQTIDPHTENHKLPFDRDVVGTYSCHGVEPVYDDDDDGNDNEHGAEDGEDEYYYVGEANVLDEQQQIQQDTREAFPDSHPYLEDNNNNNNDDDDDNNNDEGEKDDKRGAHSSEPTEHPQQPQHPSSEQPEEAAALPVTVAKINQDRGGVVFPYGNCPKTALFAVYDGHGQGGELVSQYALHEIQRQLERHPAFGTDLATALRETFLAVDEQLKDEPLIEPLFCGTTACVAVLRDQRLTLANCGDSRAVCARRMNRNTSTAAGSSDDGSHTDHHRDALPPASWLALDLTADQNPDVPAELERIVAAGGHITLPPAPGLSARVWLDSDCTQIGLAMARSLGDHAVASVGVIAEPEITTHDVRPEDEFLILASDGVWEFIESVEAVRIVGAHLGERGSATKACQALIEAAAARWHEEEGAYRDDITAIVVRLPEVWKRSSQPALLAATTDAVEEGA